MKKLFKKNRQAGMSYVELIVVLSIFSVLSGVVIYNYGDFQSKVDIKNLSSDIGLKIVEAQKSSLSGLLPKANVSSTWKPSYGVHFNLADKELFETGFIYFTDLNADKLFSGTNCTGECLEKITLGKNAKISKLSVFYTNTKKTGSMDISAQGGGIVKQDGVSLSDLTITFSRPSSGAIIKSSSFPSDTTATISYVQITVISSKSTTSTINIYPSGRIQVN